MLLPGASVSRKHIAAHKLHYTVFSAVLHCLNVAKGKSCHTCPSHHQEARTIPAFIWWQLCQLNRATRPGGRGAAVATCLAILICMVACASSIRLCSSW